MIRLETSELVLVMEEPTQIDNSGCGTGAGGFQPGNKCAKGGGNSLSQGMETYCQAINKLTGGKGTESFVAQHGQQFEGAALSAGIKKGKQKRCFQNSLQLAIANEGWTYVEGYATAPDLHGIPIHHAWALDKAGTVVDSTWDKPEEAGYFGVRIDPAAMSAYTLKTGTYGLSPWKDYISLPEPMTQNADCGTGKGGFKAGNRCAKGGKGTGSVASAKERARVLALAKVKIDEAPVPSAEAVKKAQAELEKAKQGEGRAGGEARGGSAEARRKQRENLFKEFGGEKKGYVVCPWTGLKMHYTTDKAKNPLGLPTFERGKIFTKCQGGGYQLPNLIPESFTANRQRNDKRLRVENSHAC